MEQEEVTLGADNSGFANAKSISVNTAVSGSLPTSGTVNYYKFTLPQAGYVYMEFSHGYVDRDRDFWNFSIYDGSYEYIMDRNSNGKKLSTSYSSVGLVAGTYYVKIKSVNGSEVSYNFIVHSNPADNWEKEKNETFETANVFGTNTIINGSIRQDNDIDILRLQAAMKMAAYFSC